MATTTKKAAAKRATPAAKKRNPQDATLRNIRALKGALIIVRQANKNLAAEVVELACTQNRLLQRVVTLTERIAAIEKKQGQ